MVPSNQTPTFNMKVVVQETGLKPDTLRAWERRYGMPNPERTAGGHRLYSQYEIDMLKWMVAKQNDGLSISHAVELWRQLEENGQNPLSSLTEKSVAEPAEITVSGSHIEGIRDAWVQACLDYDEYQAQHLLARAFALFPVETVCHQILQQGLNSIGEGWYAGEVTVQQEHFASALALRQLEALLASLPAPTRNGRILIGCPPGELHTFAPLMINLLLRRQGWHVVYLGANVPLNRLEKSVRQIKPLLVVMSAQTLTAAGNLLPLAQQLQTWRIPFAFGGIVFNTIPQIVQAMPGYYLGQTLEEVPHTVKKIIDAPPPLPKIKTAVPAHQALYHYFVEQRSAIDASLHRAEQLSKMPPTLLSNINAEFGNNIEAALRLGDLALLQANLDWVKGLLLNHHEQVPDQMLDLYLRQYQEAVQAVMDKRAAPILNWFAQLSV